MQGGWQPPPGGAPPGYGAAPPSMGFAQNPYGAPQMGGAPGMMSGSYGNYEFNDMENQIIDKTASRAKLWGIISTTIGALQVLQSCGAVASPILAISLPTGIVMIVVGVTFMGVGSSLKMVVQTQGNDLMHMMQALQKMGSAFTVQIVAYVIGFVLTVLAFMLVAFVLVAAAASS